jgi:two-component system chemotaxis response regulator CheB
MRRVVMIGASAGGVDALQTIASMLPRDFPCPILTVLHIGRHQSILPQLLASRGALSASHAQDGDPLRPAHFHVAPPDQHLMVAGDRIALSGGPREHHSRPAIDPLMRSGALEFGTLAVGVVLTGHGEDGTPGLQAIGAAGGVTVVQDPETARYPSMPASASKYAKPDHCLPLEAIAPTLVEIARQPLPASRAPVPAMLRHEQDLFLAKGNPMEHLQAMAKPSPFVCPDCQGGLWEVTGANPPRFRCHTGHGYTLSTLQTTQASHSDSALWSAFRALQEEALLLRRMAETAHEEGSRQEATRLMEAAARIDAQAGRLRLLVEEPRPR